VDGVSWLARFGEINNEKINPLFLSGCLFFRYLRYRPPSAVRWRRPLLPLANGGQANIAVSNTDPNLFTVPGDRITAINSLDGGLTNQEQTDSGGAILATVSKKPFTFIVETERGLNFPSGRYHTRRGWPDYPAGLRARGEVIPPKNQCMNK
jgi:hypothetical protein